MGWSAGTLAVRPFAGGVSLALTAPIDALYAATDVNEAAWEAASAELEGRAAEPAATVVARLRAAIAGERNPALVALREAARARDVTFLAGEELVSVGTGSGALVWPAGAAARSGGGGLAPRARRAGGARHRLQRQDHGGPPAGRDPRRAWADRGLHLHRRRDRARRAPGRGRLQRAERRPAAAPPARGRGGRARDRARRAAAPRAQRRPRGGRGGDQRGGRSPRGIRHRLARRARRREAAAGPRGPAGGRGGAQRGRSPAPRTGRIGRRSRRLVLARSLGAGAGAAPGGGRPRGALRGGPARAGRGERADAAGAGGRGPDDAGRSGASQRGQRARGGGRGGGAGRSAGRDRARAQALRPRRPRTTSAGPT